MPSKKHRNVFSDENTTILKVINCNTDEQILRMKKNVTQGYWTILPSSPQTDNQHFKVVIETRAEQKL